jgi:NAD(P)-dependent dehydrogenase (short-subunit alcohol dehydrogenase family)
VRTLKGRRASSPRFSIVTGSTSGIGKTTTELALSRGDKVVATARNPSALDYLKTQYPLSQLLVVRADVTSLDDILKAFAQAKNAFGRVDVVLNNAAIGCFGEVEGTPQDVARRIFETNFWGAANVTREAVRFFREENPPGAGGRLLNLSSYVGLVAVGGAGYYCAAKAGKPRKI